MTDCYKNIRINERNNLKARFEKFLIQRNDIDPLINENLSLALFYIRALSYKLEYISDVLKVKVSNVSLYVDVGETRIKVDSSKIIGKLSP